MPVFVPAPGDIVWLAFSPRAGREQAGHRPAVVLSSRSYNAKVGLMLCCPTTTRIKGYPFEVPLQGAPPSVALADQVRSLDWRAREARPKGVVEMDELNEIRRLAGLLLGVRAG